MLSPRFDKLLSTKTTNANFFVIGGSKFFNLNKLLNNLNKTLEFYNSIITKKIYVDF